MQTRILVTGGLGFIGYHLCRRLLRREPAPQLTIVDNLSSTQLDFSALRDHAEIIIDDLRNLDSSRRFDEIYHLASPVGSLGILERSGHIAMDILELADKAASLALSNRAPLLYVSSSEVYGRSGAHAEDVEQIVPCRSAPRMEYALGKLTAEHVLKNLASSQGLDVRIVRPYNVIGEWQSAGLGFVVPRFFEAALTRKPLTVFGDGRQCRAFCHVSDMVAGIVAAQEKGNAGEIYNVGNDSNVVSVQELASNIRALCQSGSDIEHVDPQQLYGMAYVEAFDKIPEIRKIRRDTGWMPKVDLDGALRRIHAHNIAKGRSLLVPASNSGRTRREQPVATHTSV